MLTPGLFDIRFREQFDLLSPLKLFGCPSERQAGYCRVWRAKGGEQGVPGWQHKCTAIRMTAKVLLIRSHFDASPVSLSARSLYALQYTINNSMSPKRFKAAEKICCLDQRKVIQQVFFKLLPYWKSLFCLQDSSNVLQNLKYAMKCYHHRRESLKKNSLEMLSVLRRPFLHSTAAAGWNIWNLPPTAGGRWISEENSSW